MWYGGVLSAAAMFPGDLDAKKKRKRKQREDGKKKTEGET